MILFYRIMTIENTGGGEWQDVFCEIIRRIDLIIKIFLKLENFNLIFNKK